MISAGTGLDRESLELILKSLKDYAKDALPDHRLLEFDHTDEFPEDVIAELCGPDIGIQLLFVPEAYDGMGGDSVDVYRVCEAMGHVDLGIATATRSSPAVRRSRRSGGSRGSRTRAS